VWTIWATFAAAVGLLFFASFLAWRVQYRENVAAREIGSVGFESVRINIFKDKAEDKHGGFQGQIVLKSLQDRMIKIHLDKFPFSQGSETTQAKLADSYLYARGDYTYTSDTIPVPDLSLGMHSGDISLCDQLQHDRQQNCSPP
jgi:hypothetical protein